MQQVMILRRQIFRYVRPLCSPSPHVIRRSIMSNTSSTQPPVMLPADVLIDEERGPGYRSELYYPANPGDVLNDRYQLLTKIGWGLASTVWLAQDLQRTTSQHVTLKIATSDPNQRDKVLHELDINKELTDDSPNCPCLFVRAAHDNFIATGPAGAVHLCLVFETLRETIDQFRHRLEGNRIPSQILKVHIDMILEGLEYLHSFCQIVHTDLKADNILLTFEDQSVIKEYVKNQADHPMPRKKVGDRNIYLSHNNFGPLKSLLMFPKIVDFGLAHRVDNEKPLRHPIQPPLYHAPEVLLGVPWSYSTDIWNLGVLIFELLEDKQLFSHLKSQNNVYTAKAHLGEMIGLLGPPPSKLIEQAAYWSDIPWERSFPGGNGKWCNTAREYYRGPFFDSKGVFKHSDAIPKNVQIKDYVTCMKGEEKELFLDFIGGFLKWLPEDRKTAEELRQHPWLQSGLS